jgi:hypothetical protein
LLLVAGAARGDVLLKNNGTTVGPVTTLNCGTNMTCSRSGSVGTIASSGGGGSNPNVTCAADEALRWDGSSWSCISKIRAAWMADAGITAQTATALASDPTDCGPNQYATAINASGDLTCSQVAYSQLTGTPTIPPDTSGASYWTRTPEASLSNETAMSSLGTGIVLNTSGTGTPSIYAGAACTNQFIRSLDALGAPTCNSVHLATDTTGTLPISKGGTTETAATDNAVLVGVDNTDWAPKVLPSCSNPTTDKLLYNTTTRSFSCGTDQTGGGYATIEDDGTALPQRTTLNFVGDGIECKDVSAKTVCNINSPATYKLKNSNVTNSTTTPANTGLEWPVTAGTTYGFRCTVLAQGTSTSLPRFNFSGPSMTHFAVATRRFTTTSAQTLLVLQAPSSSPQTAACTSSCNATVLPSSFEGVFLPSASGTFSIQVSSSTDGQTVTVYRGSHCEVF